MFTVGSEEVPSADQPSPIWPPDGVRRSSSPSREHQLLLNPDGRHLLPGDGGDLWNLEKSVEELKLKLHSLEEKQRNDSNAGTATAQPSGEAATLQAEVTWLKRGLEEHLRMFKNVFSNADVLAQSDATLELDKLWQLVKKKEKRGGGGGGKATGKGGHHRSRRESTGKRERGRFQIVVSSADISTFYC